MLVLGSVTPEDRVRQCLSACQTGSCWTSVVCETISADADPGTVRRITDECSAQFARNTQSYALDRPASCSVSTLEGDINGFVVDANPTVTSNRLSLAGWALIQYRHTPYALGYVVRVAAAKAIARLATVNPQQALIYLAAVVDTPGDVERDSPVLFAIVDAIDSIVTSNQARLHLTTTVDILTRALAAVGTVAFNLGDKRLQAVYDRLKPIITNSGGVAIEPKKWPKQPGRSYWPWVVIGAAAVAGSVIIGTKLAKRR